MRVLQLIIIFSFQQGFAKAQNMCVPADSIRRQHKVPELAYAVVSHEQILELAVLGIKKINTNMLAEPTDRFRIGSNTKAITGFIAALLVKNQKIKWDTKFFDLYPELKANSNRVYHELTLLNLLSCRTRLIPYTYTYPTPKADAFNGSEEQQRYDFTMWFFQQKPVGGAGAFHFSNLGYVAAALMLEKASGKTYKALVEEFGKQLGINFGFGAPNASDVRQPWGHDDALNPEPPGRNQKLGWLQAAGNINLSIGDYAKFIQLQLIGLQGKSNLLSKAEFEFLHYGLGDFAIGWFWQKDKAAGRISFNTGNPGTFLSKVYVIPGADRAFILFTNAQTEESEAGIDSLYEVLRGKYIQ